MIFIFFFLQIPGVEIGQREKISDLDLERIRRMYECESYRNTGHAI